ncbi:DESI1, partial [Symbiodinium sp. KB8]
ARLKQVPVFLNVYDVGDGEEVLLHHFDCAFGMLGIFTETPTARSFGSDSLLSSTARATVIMISEVSEVKALLMQELREFQVQLVGELREMLNQQRESIISEVAVCLRCKNAEAGHSHSKQPTSFSLLDEDDKNLEPFESSDPQYDCDWATLESTTRRLDLFAEELQDADVGHTITHKYEDNLWSQVSITEKGDAGALNEHSPDRVLSALPSLGASGDVDASVLSRPEEGCSSIASCTSIEVKPESEPGSLWHSPTLESRSPIATNVYLFLYDISHGWACYLSDAVLGQTIRGLYHTSVVIKWDDREEWAMEYYIGEGRIQVSQAGRTAFGRPIDKRFVGISSKTMAETAHFLERLRPSKDAQCFYSYFCARRQHPMFTEGTYDLAHNNCNSFSAAMLQYLCDWQLGIPKCFIMREQFGKKCCRRTLQLFPVVTRVGLMASEDGDVRAVTEGTWNIFLTWRMLSKIDVINFSLVETDTALEEVKWTRALETWMAVIMEGPDLSSIGVKISGKTGSDALKNLRELFGRKSSSTVAKRGSALQKYVRWLHGAFPGQPALPFSSQYIDEYLESLQEQRCKPGAFTSFTEAVNFGVHVVGLPINR